MNGQGTLMWSNGDRYVGDWENNRASGRCKLITANGMSYEGQVSDNFIHGSGTVTIGSMYYMGDFEYGDRQGCTKWMLLYNFGVCFWNWDFIDSFALCCSFWQNWMCFSSSSKWSWQINWRCILFFVVWILIWLDLFGFNWMCLWVEMSLVCVECVCLVKWVCVCVCWNVFSKFVFDFWIDFWNGHLEINF